MVLRKIDDKSFEIMVNIINFTSQSEDEAEIGFVQVTTFPSNMTKYHGLIKYINEEGVQLFEDEYYSASIKRIEDKARITFGFCYKDNRNYGVLFNIFPLQDFIELDNKLLVIRGDKFSYLFSIFNNSLMYFKGTINDLRDIAKLCTSKILIENDSPLAKFAITINGNNGESYEEFSHNSERKYCLVMPSVIYNYIIENYINPDRLSYFNSRREQIFKLIKSKQFHHKMNKLHYLIEEDVDAINEILLLTNGNTLDYYIDKSVENICQCSGIISIYFRSNANSDDPDHQFGEIFKELKIVREYCIMDTFFAHKPPIIQVKRAIAN